MNGPDAASERYDDGTPPLCGCDKRCGDLAEARDHPRAVCKGLPRSVESLLDDDDYAVMAMEDE